MIVYAVEECLSMPLLFFSRKVRATCGEVKWILSEQQGDVEGERWLRANNLGLTMNRPNMTIMTLIEIIEILDELQLCLGCDP